MNSHSGRTGQNDYLVLRTGLFEFGLNTSNICISTREQLYETSLQEARKIYYNLISENMREKVLNCKTVVELGCGYGYNLWMLKQFFTGTSIKYYGGEYSENAVRLATHLYEDEPDISVHSFNFYDEDTYHFLETIDYPIVLFTSHAIEQIPSSKPVLDILMKHRNRIKSVFHFEPINELYNDSLLGLMRLRYTEVNDYNRDLLSELQSREFVHILRTQSHVIGLNPLNPTSVIEWEFV